MDPAWEMNVPLAELFLMAMIADPRLDDDDDGQMMIMVTDDDDLLLLMMMMMLASMFACLLARA